MNYHDSDSHPGANDHPVMLWLVALGGYLLGTRTDDATSTAGRDTDLAR